MIPKPLDGNVALVTGGGRGIGRCVCMQLAELGARLVINDLDPEPAADVVREIAGFGGEAIAVPGDVTAADFPETFLARAIERFGNAHLLINNAGYIWNGPVHRMSDEQWDSIVDVHLRAPFRIARAFHAAVAPRIVEEKATGVRVRRKIVNVSSVAATGGTAGQVNYSAAKAGLFGLTRSLAKEWGRLDINVNCVAFGFIETRLTQEISGETSVTVAGEKRRVGLTHDMVESIRRQIALGRPGTPDEAAGGITLLCLPQSNYVTGQILRIDGGLAN
ncbi:MAG: SDR family oxidoreductase [Candidatus Eremiobacteraeota bacterium]|nr:SDR family oxidoreductase [Candidatus Eremiobacteraeota bacterium]